MQFAICNVHCAYQRYASQCEMALWSRMVSPPLRVRTTKIIAQRLSSTYIHVRVHNTTHALSALLLDSLHAHHSHVLAQMCAHTHTRTHTLVALGMPRCITPSPCESTLAPPSTRFPHSSSHHRMVVNYTARRRGVKRTPSFFSVCLSAQGCALHSVPAPPALWPFVCFYLSSLARASSLSQTLAAHTDSPDRWQHQPRPARQTHGHCLLPPEGS